MIFILYVVNNVVTKYRQQQASIQARAKVKNVVLFYVLSFHISYIQSSSPKVQEVVGLIDKMDHKGLLWLKV